MFCLVSGSAASGTTFVRLLSDHLAQFVCHDAVERPAADALPRCAQLESWVCEALSAQQHGQNCLLATQSPLSELLACPSTPQLDGIAAQVRSSMPHTIVTKDGTAFVFHEYELPPLGPREVRIQVAFAAPKHGTEAHLIRGSAHDLKRWDPELRMFLPRPADAPAPLPIERAIGNIVVGIVLEIGAAVTRFAVGERVFGYGPICEVCHVSEDRCYSAAGLSDADAVCVDPAHVALVAVRDGNVRVGDTVAVYGLGAIGLCAVQIARIGGARTVCAVDPVALRRTYAASHGADAIFDPMAVDAALQIKLATGRKGVDVAIETSGSDQALHDSIRCLRQCGTVVHVPWGPTTAAHLHLDEEFHINRPLIVGSQAWAGWDNPDRSYPRWNHERAYAAAIELFRAGLITGAGMVHPIVPFADAPAALHAIITSPETTIKMGVRF